MIISGSEVIQENLFEMCCAILRITKQNTYESFDNNLLMKCIQKIDDKYSTEQDYLSVMKYMVNRPAF